MVQVARDVLEGGVGDPGAPADVERAQLAQVLRDQLDPVVRDLGAAGERENRQVRKRMHWKGYESSFVNSMAFLTRTLFGNRSKHDGKWSLICVKQISMRSDDAI